MLDQLRSAAASMVGAVRADHQTLRTFHRKYGGSAAQGNALMRDAVERVGFQLLTAYRVMRFFSEVDAKLACRATSRLIRHLYGSDIHWDADFAPGVMVVHGMGMAISHSAKVGHDVVLFQNCTLGIGRHPDTKQVGAPTVEDRAVIGAGAVLLGPITIGARTKVMPGCVVVRSVPPDSVVESPSAKVTTRVRTNARARVGGRGE